MKVDVVRGDITKFSADVIVNAANPVLRGGGGVDGAIHRAAGPVLAKYMARNYPLGIHTGMVVESPAFGLSENGVDHIFHTVGPDCRFLPDHLWGDMLQLCYRNSLDLTRQLNLTSIAFPSISTGVYGYPFEEAAEEAIDSVFQFSRDGAGSVNKVTFVCFSEADVEIYEDTLNDFSL